MNDHQFSSGDVPQTGEHQGYHFTEVETVDTVAAVFMGIL